MNLVLVEVCMSDRVTRINWDWTFSQHCMWYMFFFHSQNHLKCFL